MAMTWIYKHGQVGRVLTGTLLADGAAIDLTNKTVTMYARKTETATPVINGVTVTKDSDQTTNPGRISYTLTANDVSPTLVPRNITGYLLEFKLVEGTNVDFVPLTINHKRTYGRLIVQSNLD